MARKSADKNIRVHCEPGNVEITVAPETNLLETVIQAGVPIIAACGGAGTCGTCKVVIESGEVSTTRTARLSDKEFAQGVRQACQSRVVSDLAVYIPLESRLETAVLSREKRTTSEVVATGWRFKPPLTKYFVELPPPTIDDNVSDLSRLLRGLKQRYQLRNMTVDFGVVKKLSQAVRAGDWKVTVTALVTAVESQAAEKRRPRIINVQPGDCRSQHFSLAFDIGTTTVCGQLLDLTRGRVIAESVEYNRQISHGADVISRIAYSQKSGGLSRLQKAVVTNINSIISQLLSQSQVDIESVGHLIVAGNTTMIQLLLALDPKYIRLAPYTPVATYFPPVQANSLGIKVPDYVYLFAFPAVASYVGGDIVSGILAAGVHQTKKLTCYIDIGTNGELVVGNADWMATAACSAGPAFEGGGVKHGMVATRGAIEDFSVNPSDFEPALSIIGGEKARGICGSGLINIIAGLLEVGIIGRNGKFNTDLATRRIRRGRDGYEYVLADAAETQINKDIVITEADIDNLIRAKAAVYAGCQTLLNSVGIAPQDIEQVIIAGAFGSHINIEKAITIGLLPDLPLDKFVFIGNGSLWGARLTSFSTDMLDDARRAARVMTNMELSENTTFMNNYVAALFLPHTNSAEFPSVIARLANRPTENSERRVGV